MTLAVQDIVDSRKIANEVRERSQESFKAFIRLAWDVVEPGVPLLWNWHLDAITEHLEAVYRGEINRFICNIAPGHAKSTIFSVMFPCWMWIKNPTSRWLCASHSLDLAIRDNRNCRNLIESSWFQMCFGNIFHLSSDQNVKSFFENNHRGYRMALSVGAKSGTGKRGTYLLIDDPNNATATKIETDNTVNWFASTWMSRINSYETGAMIVVGQRLREGDLTGHILKLGGWEHLCLPEEFEPNRKSFTKIGWKDPRTEEGELLWPEKFHKSVLDTLKHSLGSINYAAQFQQSPVPSGGSQFNKKWLRYFTETDQAYILETSEGTRSVLKERCHIFSTVDLAISSKQTADYTVFSIWAVSPEKDLILIDVIRDHFNNPEQLKQLRLLSQRYKDIYFKIESVAYQVALVQQALAEGIPCRPYNPSGKGDKVARASIASIWMENGKIYFNKTAPYLTDLETELLLFPMAAHDDVVDTLSIAADDIVNPSGSSIWSMDDDDMSVDGEMIDGPQYPSMFQSMPKAIVEDTGEWFDGGDW